MRKYAILTMLILFVLVLTSCLYNEEYISIGDEKQPIILKKYGELEYINEGIIIYKNLEDVFSNVAGIDYIKDHSAKRLDGNPEFIQNFYVYVDIVKQDETYKLLIYNDYIKPNADRSKMYILTDYIFPVQIEDIIRYFETIEVTQSIGDFEVNYIKKDRNYNNNLTNTDDLTLAYFNKVEEGKVFMTLYDQKTGFTILASKDDLIVGNVVDKSILLPTNLNYEDYISLDYQTLYDDKVPFSLDNETTYHTSNEKLETFDIIDEKINSETRGMIFFFAWTYEAFIKELEIAKNKDVPSHYYLNDEGFDNLVEIYDETYFEKNILLFYFKMEANISENYIYSVTKNENTLNVNVNRFEGMATALSSWLNIITIKKDDVVGIKDVNVIVRTVASPQATVNVYVHEDYIRDIYMYGKTIEDFKGLNNLKDIQIQTRSIIMDFKFNKDISDEDLNLFLQYLEDNEHIISIIIHEKSLVRVQIKNSFYDKVTEKTLVLTDVIEDDAIIRKYELTFSIFNFVPRAYITFELEKTGRLYADQLIEALIEARYEFLNMDIIF